MRLELAPSLVPLKGPRTGVVSGLGELADSLIGFDLLQAPDVPVSASTWLELTAKGVDLARERWKDPDR